jgi:hypothetical protein
VPAHGRLAPAVLESFYTTAAQASFTLLALWWVLLQIRHDAWIADVSYRRTVYDVSFYFLLPGMMSLGSLLAVQESSVWRASFALLGAVGVVESLILIAGRREMKGRGFIVESADWVSLVLYSLVVAVALWTGLPDELGLGLQPLELEGILLAGLIFLGITLAAALFVTTGPNVQRPGEQPPS